MKKMFTLSLAFAFFPMILNAQLLNPMFDQLISPPTFPTNYWPTFKFLESINGELVTEVYQNNAWIYDTKSIVTKDERGFLTNHKNYTYSPSTGTWIPEVEYEAENSYNGSGKITGIKTHFVQGSDVEYITRRTITYKSNGEYGSISGLDSMNYSGIWIVTPFIDTMKYNASGKIIERSVVSSVPGIFAFEYKMNISYNGAGKPTEVIYQNGFLGMFQDWLKYIYTYNSSNQPVSIRWFTYNENAGSFVEEHIDSLYYPSVDQVIHVIYELDDFNNLVPQDKGIFTYDAGGRLQQFISYSYNNGWVPSDSTRYYYSKGFSGNMQVFNWTGSGWSETPSKRGTFSPLLTEIKKNEIRENVLKIYPNPVTDIASITGAEVNGYSIISIYSIDGRLVQKLQAEKQLDLSGLQPGYYVLKLENRDKVYTTRFLKQ